MQTDAQDPKIENLLREMDTLLEQANSQVQAMDKMRQETGVEPGAALRYLESGQVPAAEREQALREIAEFRDEIERDARDARERAKQQSSMSKSSTHGRPLGARRLI